MNLKYDLYEKTILFCNIMCRDGDVCFMQDELYL